MYVYKRIGALNETPEEVLNEEIPAEILSLFTDEKTAAKTTLFTECQLNPEIEEFDFEFPDGFFGDDETTQASDAERQTELDAFIDGLIETESHNIEPTEAYQTSAVQLIEPIPQPVTTSTQGALATKVKKPKLSKCLKLLNKKTDIPLKTYSRKKKVKNDAIQSDSINTEKLKELMSQRDTKRPLDLLSQLNSIVFSPVVVKADSVWNQCEQTQQSQIDVIDWSNPDSNVELIPTNAATVIEKKPKRVYRRKKIEPAKESDAMILSVDTNPNVVAKTKKPRKPREKKSTKTDDVSNQIDSAIPNPPKRKTQRKKKAKTESANGDEATDKEKQMEVDKEEVEIAKVD